MFSIEGAVVFRDGDSNHWLMRYLQPGFKHCFVCIKYDSEWIIINGMNSHNHVEIVENLQEITQKHDKIQYFSTNLTKDIYRGGLCWFNCVEVVKAHLGVKSFWCWTPYQLYKLLKRFENV